MVKGYCHICGNYGEMSKEHVPPKSIGNKLDTKVFSGDNLLKIIASDCFPWDIKDKKGKEHQGGVKYPVLCEDCNNFCGNEYVKAFKEFTVQTWKQISNKDISKLSEIKLKYIDIKPLKIAKQIITMFLAMNRKEFGDANQELRDFVLNPKRKGLSNKYRLMGHITVSSLCRASGLNVIMKSTKEGVKNLKVSEITFPPMAFVLELDPKDKEITPNITFICNEYDYNDIKSLKINLPINEINSYLPLDKRSRQEIIATREASM